MAGGGRGQEASALAASDSALATFSCWGRDHIVDGSGLFAGLKVAAQSGLDQAKRDILAAPVRVELVQDGKAVALTPDAALTDVKTADHKASWKGALEGNGCRVESDVAIEYDG